MLLIMEWASLPRLQEDMLTRFFFASSVWELQLPQRDPFRAAARVNVGLLFLKVQRSAAG